MKKEIKYEAYNYILFDLIGQKPILSFIATTDKEAIRTAIPNCPYPFKDCYVARIAKITGDKITKTEFEPIPWTLYSMPTNMKENIAELGEKAVEDYETQKKKAEEMEKQIQNEQREEEAKI